MIDRAEMEMSSVRQSSWGVGGAKGVIRSGKSTLGADYADVLRVARDAVGGCEEQSLGCGQKTI